METGNNYQSRSVDAVGTFRPRIPSIRIASIDRAFGPGGCAVHCEEEGGKLRGLGGCCPGILGI